MTLEEYHRWLESLSLPDLRREALSQVRNRRSRWKELQTIGRQTGQAYQATDRLVTACYAEVYRRGDQGADDLTPTTAEAFWLSVVEESKRPAPTPTTKVAEKEVR